mgnify:CR=1 FL=1
MQTTTFNGTTVNLKGDELGVRDKALEAIKEAR